MMKLLLIFLLPFYLNAQMFVFDKDDFLHHYAGVTIAVSGGLLTYNLLPAKHKHRILESCFVAFGLAGVAGQLKEEVYDLRWGLGTYSNVDKGVTTWGATCGTVYLGVGLNLYEIRQARKLNPRYKFNK